MDHDLDQLETVIDDEGLEFLVLTDENYNYIRSIPEVGAYLVDHLEDDEDAGIYAVVQWAVAQGYAGVSMDGLFFEPANQI